MWAAIAQAAIPAIAGIAGQAAGASRTSTNITNTSASSVSASVNPIIGVNIGYGSAGGTSGGGGQATASAPATVSGYGSDPWGGYFGQPSASSPNNAGALPATGGLGDILGNPILLIGGAALIAWLAFGGK